MLMRMFVVAISIFMLGFFGLSAAQRGADSQEEQVQITAPKPEADVVEEEPVKEEVEEPIQEEQAYEEEYHYPPEETAIEAQPAPRAIPAEFLVDVRMPNGRKLRLSSHLLSTTPVLGNEAPNHPRAFSTVKNLPLFYVGPTQPGIGLVRNCTVIVD